MEKAIGIFSYFIMKTWALLLVYMGFMDAQVFDEEINSCENGPAGKIRCHEKITPGLSINWWRKPSTGLLSW